MEEPYPLLEFEFSEEQGMAIGNLAAVRKLKLGYDKEEDR